jgi:hypothetical protein
MQTINDSNLKEGKMKMKDAGMLGWLKSKKRREELYKKRIEKYYEKSNLCVNCNSVICYEKRFNKFCSHTCSAIYNNTRKQKKLKTCFCCKQKFHSKQKISKYCSKECEINFKNEKIINEWKEGKNKGYSGKTMLVPHWLRRYMFKKFNSKCCKCGWCEKNKTTNKIPLEVNHIDGDASNSKEENLELLCPNCHSLTSNYKALNKISKRNRKKQPPARLELAKDF